MRLMGPNMYSIYISKTPIGFEIYLFVFLYDFIHYGILCLFCGVDWHLDVASIFFVEIVIIEHGFLLFLWLILCFMFFLLYFFGLSFLVLLFLIFLLCFLFFFSF